MTNFLTANLFGVNSRGTDAAMPKIFPCSQKEISLFNPEKRIAGLMSWVKRILGVETLTVENLTRQNWSEVPLQMR